MTRDTGKIYRYNGMEWIEIKDIDPTAINEVDSRLSKRLAEGEGELVIDNQNILDIISQDLNFDVTTPIIGLFDSMLTSLANDISPDTFNLLFITDAHWEESTFVRTSLAHYKHAIELTKRGKIDVLVCGGDNVNGNSQKQLAVKFKNDFASVVRTRTNINTDVVILKGNHDDNSTYARDYDGSRIDEVILDSELIDIYGNNLWSFSDYPEHRVRVIGLNSSDLPFVTNVDGSLKYVGVSNSGFQHVQLEWLANTALKLPDNNWQVIVYQHHPLNGALGTVNNQHNTESVYQILESFMSGSDRLVVSNIPDFYSSVQTSFSGQGPGTVIAVVVGHYHLNWQREFRGMMHISVENSQTWPRDERFVGTHNQDSWDVLCIDRTNRVINVAGFGNSPNRQIRY